MRVDGVDNMDGVDYTPGVMSQECLYPPASTAIPASRTSAVLDVVAVAGAVALGACVRIPLPFTPAPITLQTFPVLLAAYAVGRHRAMAGMLLYLLLGFAGAPLFAAPFGPTFGYLLAFAAAPWVTTRFRSPAHGILAATLLIYAAGATGLCLWLRCTPWQALVLGVFPFLAGDALKAVAAYHLVDRVRPNR